MNFELQNNHHLGGFDVGLLGSAMLKFMECDEDDLTMNYKRLGSL